MLRREISGLSKAGLQRRRVQGRDSKDLYSLRKEIWKLTEARLLK